MPQIYYLVRTGKYGFENMLIKASNKDEAIEMVIKKLNNIIANDPYVEEPSLKISDVEVFTLEEFDEENNTGDDVMILD